MSNVTALPSHIVAHTVVDDPKTEIRIGLVVGSLFFVGLLGWAAVAPLDSAVYAGGTVKVLGDVQTVQNLESGVISQVNVREGQQVRAGDVLMEFATTQALAQERSLAVRVIGLQAEAARLAAEEGRARDVAVPIEFAVLPAQDRGEAERAMQTARAQFRAWQQTSASEDELLGQRIAQVGNQLRGYDARQQSNEEQLGLNEKELATVQQLYSKGFATQTRVLALQRSAADLKGQRGAQTAEMARLRNENGEARMQLIQTRAQRDEQIGAELRQAQNDLQSLIPQWRAARDVLARTQLRAPVTGAVMGLSVGRAGSVAMAGQKLMEIVPQDRALVVEAQVAPGDVNDLAVGQAARIRVNGLHGRNVPVLNGSVRRISADSFVEDRTGRTYYTASVTVPATELDRAAKAARIPGTVRAGTPVQVQITLRPRTALQYILEPLGQIFTGALHER